MNGRFFRSLLADSSSGTGPVNTSGTLHVRGVDVKDTTSYVTQTPPVVVSVYHALIPGVTMGDTHALLQAIAARTGTRYTPGILFPAQFFKNNFAEPSDTSCATLKKWPTPSRRGPTVFLFLQW